jgi:hypothetical protein
MLNLQMKDWPGLLDLRMQMRPTCRNRFHITQELSNENLLGMEKWVIWSGYIASAWTA